ncbi:hypothetical protein Lesp02_73830 [Lentzea sp. NBRC 105346]|nr:hypothetical protein Lesp02_73830 [Lentzea sp. NBRC 105346]
MLAARKPTTPGQLRFWRLHQRDPRDPAYSWPWAVRLPSPVDVARLRRALDTVLARHELLTSCFSADDDGLWQTACGGPELRMLDADVQTALRADNELPFRLDAEPPIRVTLLPGDVLLVNVHNIANDGWSMRVFLDDLMRAYTGSALPEPTLQYHEHAARQRKWLDGPEAARQLAYWERRLDGLEIRNGTSSQSTVERVRIPRETAEAVRELGRKCKATPFMTLFGLFAGMHDQKEIAIGTSVSGRTPEVERTIGYFVNRIVLRMNTRGSVEDVVGRARTMALEAFAHSAVPFEHLVERLYPNEYLTPAPLVDVMFVLDSPRGPVIEPEYRTSKFTLVVNVQPVEDGLVVEAHHPSGASHGVLRDYAQLLKGLTT